MIFRSLTAIILVILGLGVLIAACHSPSLPAFIAAAFVSAGCFLMAEKTLPR